MKLAMIRLLAIIDRHGQNGVSTRRLLEELGANEFHGVLKEAANEELGYVRREEVKKPKGQKGNHLTVNSLTPAGRKIVQAALQLGL